MNQPRASHIARKKKKKTPRQDLVTRSSDSGSSLGKLTGKAIETKSEMTIAIHTYCTLCFVVGKRDEIRLGSLCSSAVLNEGLVGYRDLRVKRVLTGTLCFYTLGWVYRTRPSKWVCGAERRNETLTLWKCRRCCNRLPDVKGGK